MDVRTVALVVVELFKVAQVRVSVRLAYEDTRICVESRHHLLVVVIGVIHCGDVCRDECALVPLLESRTDERLYPLRDLTRILVVDDPERKIRSS